MDTTFLARAAVMRELVWTNDEVDLGGSIPGTAWAASLGVVLSDVLGERVTVILGPLARWCAAQPRPELCAQMLAHLAIGAGSKDAFGYLAAYVEA